MRNIALFLFLLMAACGAAVPAGAQQPTPDLTPPGAEHNRNEDAASRRFRREMEQKQQKEQNLQRQKEIKKDTDRLLQLATELKQYVDKSNENTLSLDVVRKADEIEKLAHSVKDKMKSGT